MAFDAVLVDACKSWYATKFFMMRVIDKAEPGTVFFFQDYGMYTCFWIPSLVGTLEQFFELVCVVDATFAFRLRAPLSSRAIDDRFPDEPSSLGRDFFDHLFSRLADEANDRDDIRSLLVCRIQHAGALAYLGFAAEAKSLMVEVSNEHRFAHYGRMIEAALRAPTYLPSDEGWEPPLLI